MHGQRFTPVSSDQTGQNSTKFERWGDYVGQEGELQKFWRRYFEGLVQIGRGVQRRLLSRLGEYN
eukprot:167202-Prymnesium_polylepis.1